MKKAENVDYQHSGIVADSFEALADIAIAELKDSSNLGMVCGPISTGGMGCPEHNFHIFEAAISGLMKNKVSLFNQIPYEYGLGELTKEWKLAGNRGYCIPILEVFYAKIFETGKITKGWFIPGWKSSEGARWERTKLTGLGCEVHDLTPVEIAVFLRLQNQHPPEHIEMLVSKLQTDSSI